MGVTRSKISDRSAKAVFSEAQFEEIKRIVGEALREAAVEPEFPKPQPVPSGPTLFGEIRGVILGIPKNIFRSICKFIFDLQEHEVEPTAFFIFILSFLPIAFVPLLLMGWLIPTPIVLTGLAVWGLLGWPVCYGALLFLTKKYGSVK